MTLVILNLFWPACRQGRDLNFPRYVISRIKGALSVRCNPSDARNKRIFGK